MARQKKSTGTGANLGVEEKLWATADKLRGHMDAAEYKHVVLGIIFLKYISDAFAELHDKLKAEGDDPEDRDYFTAENVFWVPKEARWEKLQGAAKLPTIGKLIDDAMVAIEKENPVLKGVLPKEYAKPSHDKTRLGELIDLIGTIGLGDAESRKQDILGRRYVGTEDIEDDGEPFAEKMQRLTAKLQEQFKEGAKLEKAILSNLQGLGYGG